MNFIFGYVIGMTVTFLLLYFGHCLYQFREPPVITFSKQKIVNFMSQRMAALQYEIDRDFEGGLSDRIAKRNECKYWKEAIERGVFDEDDISAK